MSWHKGDDVFVERIEGQKHLEEAHRLLEGIRKHGQLAFVADRQSKQAPGSFLRLREVHAILLGR